MIELRKISAADKMCIFVQHHIFDSRARLFRQAQTERDLPFCRHTHAPARFHLPYLQNGALPVQHLCKQRKYRIAYLCEQSQRILPGHGTGALLFLAARKSAHARRLDPSSPSGHECIHLCQRRAQGRRHGNASVSPHAQVDIFDPFSLKLIPHTACGAILRGFFVFHPAGSSCSFPAAARRGGGFLCFRVPGPLRTRALEHYTPTQMQLANPPKMPRKFSMDSA